MRGWNTQASRRSILRRDSGCKCNFRAVSAGKLLRCAGLQAGIVAARIRAEFIHVAEALIERLVVRKGAKQPLHTV